MASEKRKKYQVSLNFLVKTSAITLITIILSKLLTWAYTISIARYYGPEAFGLYSLSLMIIGWMLIFTRLGLGNGILRYTSFFTGKKDYQKINFLFTKIKQFLTLTTITGLILLILFSKPIAIYLFNEPELEKFLQLFAIAIPFAILSGAYNSMLLANQKVLPSLIISRIIENAVKITGLILLILLGLGKLSIPLSYLLATITAFICYRYTAFKSIHYLQKGYKTKDRPTEKKLLKEIFSYSWPLIFMGFALSVFNWTDSFIIGMLIGAKGVGIYAAAFTIAFTLTISLDLFKQVFFPLITKEYSKGNKWLIKELSQQTGKWIFTLSLPLFILLILIPELFIKILFGEAYLEAARALQLLSIGTMFIAISDISKELIAMTGKTKILLKLITASAIINLLLNLLLVPLYGLTGAGLATMISMIIMSISFMQQTKKRLQIIPLRKKMLPIALAGILAGITIPLIKHLTTSTIPLLLGIILIYTPIYITLAYKLGGLDKSDKEILITIKKRLQRKKA